MAKTKLMGILNATNDSFYSPSRSPILSEAIARGLKMASEGADILDIGGESTRPGALKLAWKTNWIGSFP